MKQLFFILIIASVLSSCNSDQTKAVAEAKEIQSALNEIKPGEIPTAEGGWTMKAKINGKDWNAASFMSPEAAGRIVGSNKKEYISLPYDRREMVVGYKNEFSDHNAVDIGTNDDVALWGGLKGEMEITKVDENWAEGKFHVTGTSSGTDKTVEITEGFFRISMKKTN
jgi:hypothetical protein